jgi:hypothetical protein
LGFFIWNLGQINYPNDPIAGFTSPRHEFVIGGVGDNQWISFYLFGLTLQSGGGVVVNQTHFSSKTGNYDITIQMHVLGSIGSPIKKGLIENVRIEVNKLNTFEYKTFFEK